MIHLHNVEKVYQPAYTALQNIDLRIGDGEFVFVAGASGAGKTTLLRLMYGAERATRGEVVIGGRNMRSIDRSGVALLRREIGVVFQDYKLLPRRTVVDNVSFGLEVRGVARSERERLGKRFLEMIGLGHRGDALPEALSGGEQQRVAIARALLTRPKLILADEPTGNLDQDMARLIFDLLLEANSTGVTVIVATHNLAIIEELNVRTLVLDSGKIIGDFSKPRGAAR